MLLTTAPYPEMFHFNGLSTPGCKQDTTGEGSVRQTVLHIQEGGECLSPQVPRGGGVPEQAKDTFDNCPVDLSCYSACVLASVVAAQPPDWRAAIKLCVRSETLESRDVSQPFGCRACVHSILEWLSTSLPTYRRPDFDSTLIVEHVKVNKLKQLGGLAV